VQKKKKKNKRAGQKTKKAKKENQRKTIEPETKHVLARKDKKSRR